MSARVDVGAGILNRSGVIERLAVLLALAIVCVPTLLHGDEASGRAALESAIQDWESAFVAGDADAMAALTTEDFVRILTEPDASLTDQYRALLETEEVSVEFDDSGVKRIAEVAFHVNESTENIGARRLHTVMERLLETVSFEASDKSGSQVRINAGYVDEHLSELSQDEDLSRYIL